VGHDRGGVLLPLPHGEPGPARGLARVRDPDGGKELAWSDKGLTPDSRIISPAGNASEKPEGIGTYLVGTSKGDSIADKGQTLQSVAIYDMNTTDPAYTAFVPR